jgi:hypothetical protein
MTVETTSWKMRHDGAQALKWFRTRQLDLGVVFTSDEKSDKQALIP